MSLMYTSESSGRICPFSGLNRSVDLDTLLDSEDPRTEALRRYSYGVVLPTICCFGIVGNILNLVVLTRKNMRGTAYIYMRGYSAAALLAILFAIPFAWRVLIHKETGRWSNFPQAFYHAHLELFFGNGCLGLIVCLKADNIRIEQCKLRETLKGVDGTGCSKGVGVMMLLALTVERYVSVCHPAYTRPLMGPPHLTVAIIPIVTFLTYLPSVFRGEITHCLLGPNGPLIYQKRDNVAFIQSLYYSIYKIVVEVVFKVAPTILLGGFNLRIMIVYRRTCDRRRKMTLSRKASCDEDHRKYAEERRLILLLGSTSILFLVCVSPMVILNVTLTDDNLTMYPYQVFRALANLLEITNYSMTFYIYCLFSEDFRNTLIRTLICPCGKSDTEYQGRTQPVAKVPVAATTITATGTPPAMNSFNLARNTPGRSSV
ncbi:uncharacterized protein CBL_02652 [Carabus blaptoides fortunei]